MFNMCLRLLFGFVILFTAIPSSSEGSRGSMQDYSRDDYFNNLDGNEIDTLHNKVTSQKTPAHTVKFSNESEKQNYEQSYFNEFIKGKCKGQKTPPKFSVPNKGSHYHWFDFLLNPSEKYSPNSVKADPEVSYYLDTEYSHAKDGIEQVEELKAAFAVYVKIKDESVKEALEFCYIYLTALSGYYRIVRGN